MTEFSRLDATKKFRDLVDTLMRQMLEVEALREEVAEAERINQMAKQRSWLIKKLSENRPAACRSEDKPKASEAAFRGQPKSATVRLDYETSEELVDKGAEPSQLS